MKCIRISAHASFCFLKKMSYSILSCGLSIQCAQRNKRVKTCLATIGLGIGILVVALCFGKGLGKREEL